MRTLRERITHSFLHIQDAARRKKEKEENKVKDQITHQLSRLWEVTVKKERRLAEIKICSKDIDNLRDKLIALVRLAQLTSYNQGHTHNSEYNNSEYNSNDNEYNGNRNEYNGNEIYNNNSELSNNTQYNSEPEYNTTNNEPNTNTNTNTEYLQQLEDMSSSSSVSSSDEFAVSSWTTVQSNDEHPVQSTDEHPAQSNAEHSISTPQRNTDLESPIAPTYSPHYFHHSAGTRIYAEGESSTDHKSPEGIHSSPAQDSPPQSPDETTDTSNGKGLYRTIQQKLGINTTPDKPKEEQQEEQRGEEGEEQMGEEGEAVNDQSLTDQSLNELHQPQPNQPINNQPQPNPTQPNLEQERINLTLRPTRSKGYLSVIGGEIRRGKKQNTKDIDSPEKEMDVSEKTAEDKDPVESIPETPETQQVFSTNRKLVEQKLQAIRKEGTLEDDRRLYNLLTQTINSLKGRTDFESLRVSAQLEIARKYVKDFIDLRALLQSPGALKKQVIASKKRTRYTH